MILPSTKQSDSTGPSAAYTGPPPAYEEVAPPPSLSSVNSVGGQTESIPNPLLQSASAQKLSFLLFPGHGHKSAPGSNATPRFGLRSWFNKQKGTQKEFKQTIQSLIRDVVNQPSSAESVSVIQSCHEACQARGLSFESVVSEKFIEGHCPLYWAIVKRPPLHSDPQSNHARLLDILLSFPLDSTTRLEGYLGCLLFSDQELFRRLRHMPGSGLPGVSTADKLLIGDAVEADPIIENLEGNHGEFRVKWNIVQFQKRMRVLGGIGTQVVARGRIWSLTFTIVPREVTFNGTCLKAGSWAVSISLLDPSPPTYLDALISIPGPKTPPLLQSPLLHPTSSSPNLRAPPQYPRKGPITRLRSSLKTSRKPPITLRVKTDELQLEPLPLLSIEQDLREYALTEPGCKTLIVPLSSDVNGDSLQFDGCSYLNSDGSLDVAIDARLAKPSNTGDCIIC